MSSFYNRQFALYISDENQPFIDGVVTGPVPQFRVAFSVLIDFNGFNSYADISIYNLSRETEARVFRDLSSGDPNLFTAGLDAFSHGV